MARESVGVGVQSLGGVSAVHLELATALRWEVLEVYLEFVLVVVSIWMGEFLWAVSVLAVELVSVDELLGAVPKDSVKMGGWAMVESCGWVGGLAEGGLCCWASGLAVVGASLGSGRK